MTSEKEQGEGQEQRPEEATEEPTLPEELAEANRERAQFREMALRAQADLANYRRRVEEEREELRQASAARFLLKLLPILDDLQRALDHAPADAQEEAWLEGIRLIERSLDTLLASEGVTPIEAEGQPFDPWEHEAVFSIEAEGQEHGTVVNVVRKGYKHHGKVLRVAQVTVANGKANEEESSAQQEAQTTEERET